MSNNENKKDTLNENNSLESTENKEYKESAKFIKERYERMLKTRQISIDDDLSRGKRKEISRHNKDISEEETINYNKRLELLKTKRLELDEEMKEYEKIQKQNRRRLFK